MFGSGTHVLQIGGDGILLHHGDRRDAHARRTAGGDGAGDGIGVVHEFRDHVDILRRANRHVAEFGLYGVPAHQHRHVAGDTGGTRAGHGRARQDGGITAIGPDVHVFAADLVVFAAPDGDSGLAAKYVHIDRRAHGGGARPRRGGGDVQRPGGGVGQHVDRAAGDATEATADVDVALRPGDHGIDGSRHARGLGGGGAGEDGIQPVVVVGEYVHSVTALDMGVTVHVHQGGSLVHDDGHGAARGGGARRDVAAHGDEAQVRVGIGGDPGLIAGLDDRVIADPVVGAAAGDDHVDRAACGIRARARGDSGSGVIVLDLGFDRGGQGDVLRLEFGPSGGLHGRPVVVAHIGEGQARAQLRTAHGHRAADHAGVVLGIGLCLQAAVLRLDDGKITDAGVHVVGHIADGEGARRVELAAAGHGGAGHGLHIIIGGGKEVQRVHGVERLAGVEVDLDGIVVVVLALLQVEYAGFGVVAARRVQLAGIGHEVGEAQHGLVIRPGDSQLLRGQLHVLRGDLHKVGDLRFDGILAGEHSHGEAHAHGGALGQADAARPNGELGFVGGGHGQLVARIDRGFRLGRLGAALGAADQHGHGPADGGGGIRPGHRSGQRLRAQLAPEGAVHVLGEVGLDGYVLLRGDAAVKLGPGGILIHAHGHAGGDGAALLLKGHGGRRAEGVEVAGVPGGDLNAALGGLDGLALPQGHAGVCRVTGDGDTHRRRHLELGGGAFGGLSADGLAGGVLEGVARFVLGPVALGGILRGDILAAQGVGGQGELVAGILAADGLFLIQAFVDLRRGLIAAVGLVALVVGLLVQIGAVQQLVGGILGGLGSVGHLVEGPLHIRAQRGGDGGGGVLVVVVRLHLRVVAHIHAVRGVQLRVNAGGGDVQRHRRAHGGTGASGIGAGEGVGDGLLVGGDGQRTRVAGALAVLVEGALAVGLHDIGVQHARGDVVVQYVERHGSVQREVLVAGVAGALEGIRACRAGDLLLVVGGGLEGQRPGVHLIAPADGGTHGVIAIDHGEGRAQAHALAGVVSGGDFLLAGLVEHGHGLDISLGHFEGVDGLVRIGAGLALGRVHLDLLHLALLVLDPVDDLLHAAALLALDGDVHLFAFANLQLAVLHLAALGGDLHRAGHHGLVVVVLGLSLIDGVEVLLEGKGKVDILVGLDVSGIDIIAVVILLDGDGVDDLNALVVAVARRGLVILGQAIAVIGFDVDFRLDAVQVVGFDLGGAAGGGVQGHALALHLGSGLVAAAGVLGLIGGLVVVGVATGVDGGGGHIVDLAVLHGVHGHFAGDVDVAAAVGHAGDGVGVDDGQRHGARDAHVLRAGAGDGLGVDDVLVAGGLGLQHHIHMVGEAADGGIGQRDRALLGGGAQAVGDLLLEVGLGDLGHHGLIIEHILPEGGGEVTGDGVQYGVERLLLIGVGEGAEQLGNALGVAGVDHGQLGGDAGDGGPHHLLQRLLQLHLGGMEGGLIDLIEHLARGLLGEAAGEHVRRVLGEELHQAILCAFEYAGGQVERFALELGGELIDEHRLETAQIGVAQRGNLLIGVDEGLGQLFRQGEQAFFGVIHDLRGLLELGAEIAAAQQIAQTGGVDELLGEGLHHVFGEVLHDVVGQRLGQADLLGEVVDELADGLAEVDGQRILGVRLDDGAALVLFGLHGRGHLKGSGGDRTVADIGDVIEGDDVDGDARAHAEVGFRGAGVGFDLGGGAVLGGDGGLTGGGDIDPVQDLRPALAGLDVDRDRRRAGHAALAGLGLLAVRRRRPHLFCGDALGLVLSGQLRRAGEQSVHLFVGLTGLAGLVALGLFPAGSAGSGVALHGALSDGGHGQLLGVDGLVQSGSSVVADHGYVVGSAHCHAGSGGGGVHADGMAGLLCGGQLHLVLDLQGIIRNLAQIGIGAGAGHVHGDGGSQRNAALRAGLGGDLVAHILGSGQGDLGGLALELHAVIDGGGGVRAVHGDGHARAHAEVPGHVLAGGVGLDIEFELGFHGHGQLAVICDDSVLMDERFGIEGGHLHGHRAAHADIPLGIAGLGGGLGPAGGAGIHGDVFARGDGAAAHDLRAALAVRHGDRRARAKAGLHGGGVRLAGLELAGEGDLHL